MENITEKSADQKEKRGGGKDRVVPSHNVYIYNTIFKAKA